MSTLLIERGLGLEILQNAVVEALASAVNTELDAQMSLWTTRDEELSETLGQEPDYVLLEYIEDENFHSGHRPSLIENPPKDSYPNISVMVYTSRPTADTIDQATNTQLNIDIEIMVKSEHSEAEVGKRCHRTVEAVHQVLTKLESLAGANYGWQNDPAVQLTDIFIRPDEHGHGEIWYWQGARVRYLVTRHSELPW